MGKRSLDIKRVVALARPELGVLAVATVALLVGSALSLALPLMVRHVVDGMAEEGIAVLDRAALWMVVLFLGLAVTSVLRAWLFTVTGERVVARLRTDLFRAVIGQPISFFDETRTGELTNRLASDTAVLQNTVSVNLSMALRFGIGVLGGVAMLMWMSPRLTAVTLAVVPVVAFGSAYYGRVIRRLSKQVQDALARASEVAEESLGGIRTVRAFANEPAETQRYGEAIDVSFELARQRSVAYGLFQGGASLAGYTAIGLVVWYGGRLVAQGVMTVGDLTAFLLYTLSVAVSLGTLSSLYGDFMRAFGASERVFELIDLDAGIERRGGDPLVVRSGAVRFAGVRFRYPSRPDVEVLRDVSLRADPGEVVALVGPSGAGKSTIAGLLLRYYAPQAGAVTVDGVDLADVDPASVREAIGVVSQEPVLFATSIRDNIRYGRPSASDAEVRAAAGAANALDFIDAFPEGLDTLVGERGVRLSGGQKQRVAIARALLKDPRILVLDEATSALDAENEHLVQAALDRLMKGRTTLVIAHRLSTIQGADRVVVLDGGCVVEQGRHDELLAAGGLYRKLVERQFAA